jgi:hypothetical protein
VDRVHLVERQRQFRVVRDHAVGQPRAGVIDLFEDGRQRQVVALGRQAAVDGAGTHGDQDLAVLAELTQYMHVLGVAQATLDDADIAVRAAVS